MLTVLVRHGSEKYPDAERQIAEIFRRQMPDVERSIVVVDNALPAGIIEADGGRTVIGGDNTAREFTGFEAGIRHVGDRLRTYDLIHLATDAFNTLYVSYLNRFDTALLRLIVGRPVCVGHIDCYNEPVLILGIPSQHWIRSCFLFINPVDVDILGNFATLSTADAPRFFSRSAEEPFRADAPISANLRRYIVGWLTGADIGQGVSWHSSFELTSDKLEAFEGKALSILNEHLLSIRARAMGCANVDVTWLASVLTTGAAVPWGTPWQVQLANRDRDALRISA